MEALKVVYGKLAKAGLEDFCLELHSGKANKKDFINELNRVLNLDKTRANDRAKQGLKTKKVLLEKLDGYDRELHTKHPDSGRSLYDLFNGMSANRMYPDTKYMFQDPSLSDEKLSAINTLLQRYVAYVPSIGYDYHDSIWYGYNGLDSTIRMKRKLEAELGGVTSLISDLAPIDDRLRDEYGFNIASIRQANALGGFFGLASASEFMTRGLLDPGILPWSDRRSIPRRGSHHPSSETRRISEPCSTRRSSNWTVQIATGS